MFHHAVDVKFVYEVILSGYDEMSKRNKTGNLSFFKGQNGTNLFYHTLTGKSTQMNHGSVSPHLGRIAQVAR